MSTVPFLDTLYRAGHLRVIDHALAQSLRRLDPSTPDEVLAAAALASLAVSKGHAGFLPAHPQPLLDADIAWPSGDAWLAQLQASPWVATPGDRDETADTQAPLVLENGLLYLRRYREYERRLATGLHRIGTHAPTRTELAALAPLFAQLFPAAADGEDRQARAAATALRHALLLVTGGPGTGKTTTITRLLVLLVAQARHAGHPAPRIALAAPTGRAAERMAESLRDAVQSLTALGIDAQLCAQLPIAGTTLHRLLGSIPDSPGFRHHADNPLPFDVVVVDEASMIDLPLMAKLVEAVADGARLVLLGDPDQLPSVEAGDVLSGILRAAGNGHHLMPDDAGALRLLFGHTPAGQPADPEPANPHSADRGPSIRDRSSRHSREGGDRAPSLPTPAEAPAPATEPRGESTFPARHIHLTRNYRHSTDLQLAPLAAAIREGATTTALTLLRGNTLAGVHFHEDLTDPLHTQRDRLFAHWAAIADAPSPAEALALASRLRILTAVRDGPQGARSLNARIEAMLSENGLSGGARRGSGSTAGAGPYFHGRLLLITENSYRHRLFNGDIGICLADGDGTLMAWFPGQDPQHPRPFHPAALPAHESAFAMTVHKAQGSEFEEVWLLLPARFNRVLSRELVYTGVTRARSRLHLAGSEMVIGEALSRHASRWSGLGWRLVAEKPETRPAEPDSSASPTVQRALF